MQPSRRFLSGLSPVGISRVQHRILGEIRAGQPGANDPETVLAMVTEDLRQRDTAKTSYRLLKQLVTYPREVLALVLRDIDHEKLSPEEKRRRKARKATDYRQLQIQGWGGP